jgi:putative endonuclease
MRVKDAVGRYGEQLAVDHLTGRGWQIVDRNWRCVVGELDIVARDGSVLVFVEVKTRSSTAFGDPAEAVTAVKSARLRRVAVQWLSAHREQARGAEVRFDVVSIVRLAPGGPQLRHLPGAF